MSPTVRVLLLALLAFALPIAVVGVQHQEELEKLFQIDPRTARGRVLYFVAPS